ncbi:MAG: hypothetical protein MKZ55_02080 [Candidatus Thalassarchaeum sp.]|nr:hypothetical protein [Candidatus Thalassarchaeum sp.]
MELNVKKMMTEMGGAFAVTWLIFGVTLTDGSSTGMGLAGIMGVVGLTVAWMAFKGADILPQVTWLKQMSSTDNLSDTDAWMNTGITLAMQIVGGIVAYVLVGQMYDNIFGYADASAALGDAFWGNTSWEFDMGTTLGLIAAGAVLGQVMAVDSRWAMPVAIVMMTSIIDFESAAKMASVLMNEAGDTVNVALPWLLNGVFLGAGALLGSIIDENIPGEEE